MYPCVLGTCRKARKNWGGGSDPLHAYPPMETHILHEVPGDRALREEAAESEDRASSVFSGGGSGWCRAMERL